MKITKQVREEVARLYKKHGSIDEDILVRASRRKTSPLHSLFHWDDPKKAAAVGRREIARQVIMRISVTITPAENDGLNCSVRVRKYQGGMPDGGYKDIDDVLSDEELHARMVQNALTDLRSFKTKYQTLSELSKVLRAIDRTVADLEEVEV